MEMGFKKGPYTAQQMVEFVKNGTIKAVTLCIKNNKSSVPAQQFFGERWHQIQNQLEAEKQKAEMDQPEVEWKETLAVVEEERQRRVQQTNLKPLNNQPDAYESAIPQWLFPSKLLYTPSSDFDFPNYPGLSVAMKYYVILGKIVFLLSFASMVLSIFWGMFTIFMGLSKGNLKVVEAPIFIIPGALILFAYLLLQNLALALNFASAEIVKVVVRIEANTRK